MKQLEHHKAFPIVAWVVIIGFALFTYDLTKRVDALETTFGTEKTELSIDDIDRYFEEEAP